jgi:hypothetical protein
VLERNHSEYLSVFAPNVPPPAARLLLAPRFLLAPFFPVLFLLDVVRFLLAEARLLLLVAIFCSLLFVERFNQELLFGLKNAETDDNPLLDGIADSDLTRVAANSRRGISDWMLASASASPAGRRRNEQEEYFRRKEIELQHPHLICSGK